MHLATMSAPEESTPSHVSASEAALPEAVARVQTLLERLHHPHLPVMLAKPARTSQEAADALGIEVGQVAKSVIFRREIDATAVLVVTAGDQRVNEAKVAQLIGPIARADATFVKTQTGYVIGGVSPIGHAQPVMTLLDASLQRFGVLWAAAGHPNAVFKLSPSALEAMTGAPWADVTGMT